MECHSKKEEIDRWSEILGGRLHLIYVDIRCIECITNFSMHTPIKDKKFVGIFNHFYRLFFDRVYVNICKFLDKNNNAMSVKNFFKKLNNIDDWEKIIKHPVYQKIKEKRNNIIAHDNQVLALNSDETQKHYEENKIHISEIISFLEIVQEKLETMMAHNGKTIILYALGQAMEVMELDELLTLAFTENSIIP